MEIQILTFRLLDPPEPGEVEVGRYLAADGQLVVPTHGPRQLQPLHSKATIIKEWLPLHILPLLPGMAGTTHLAT